MLLYCSFKTNKRLYLLYKVKVLGENTFKNRNKLTQCITIKIKIFGCDVTLNKFTAPKKMSLRYFTN